MPRMLEAHAPPKAQRDEAGSRSYSTSDATAHSSIADSSQATRLHRADPAFESEPERLLLARRAGRPLVDGLELGEDPAPVLELTLELGAGPLGLEQPDEEDGSSSGMKFEVVFVP